MRALGVGEVLWDIFSETERLGGAALNFCANLQRLGNTATLLSAVGGDTRGVMALRRMQELGLNIKGVQIVNKSPTGIAAVGTTQAGETTFNIPRPAAFDLVSTDPETAKTVENEGFEWLYFGTLLQTTAPVEQFTTELAAQLPKVRCFYDMNLRVGHWNLALVQRLSGLASILKLNEVEAESLFQLTLPHQGAFSLESFCHSWAETYNIEVICVTLGSAGCFVFDRGTVHRVPGFPVKVCDTVGSGDAFAAAFIHGYHRSWPIADTARFANALGALVTSRSGATPDWTIEECFALADLPPYPMR
ncbi:MAG: carbohydrate kinase [Edaphobacter sp.]